jgi:hypothetical protein
MSQFEYTLPSGAQFRVNGPAGATQLQADLVFYEQVAAGGLVGYEAGQTLTSMATRLTKFELSRLDRGTAGVDTAAILSIVQNLPVVSGIPELINTPVQNPVNQSDIVLARGDGLGPVPVGPLTAFQVQTLQAQMANLVDQPYDVITKEKGIGKFGLNCLQLEKVGYIKPGTFARYLSNDPDSFVAVMNSPAIWTGLGGISGLDQLLTDVNSQNLIQNQLMQSSYEALSAAGVISNVPQPTVTFSQGQIYTPQGLQTLNALNILGGNSGLLTNILGQPVPNLNTLASGAIANSALTQAALSISGRINGEVGALINNATKFGSIATTAWASSGGIPNLNNLLTGVPNLSGLANVNLNQLTGGLTNLIPGNIGNLKTSLDNFGKASQFSLNFTNPLTSLGNINVQRLASGALTNIQGQLGTAVTNLQGQALGAAANLQGQALGAVANIQGQLTNLQGQVTGQFKQLTNLFSGSGELVSGTQIAAGFNNTINRKTVDAAVGRILGNPKIPVPGFEFPSPESLAQKLDIAQAQNILQGIRQQGAQVLNQVNRIQSQATQIQSQATRLAGQTTATFNRLTG